MRQSLLAVLTLLTAALPASAAEVDGEIRDAAARIDFGFYTGESGLVAAVIDELSEESANPWHHYLRAYANLRMTQLMLDRSGRIEDSLDDCERAAAAVVETTAIEELLVEARVVGAACAALAATAEPLRSVLHLRRSRQALAEAAALDADNPRLLLVLHLYLQDDAGRPAASIEQATEAFELRSGSFDYPDWGEAEALTLLGSYRIERGDLRGARDALEAALLVAPGYDRALELQNQISRLAAAD